MIRGEIDDSSAATANTNGSTSRGKRYTPAVVEAAGAKGGPKRHEERSEWSPVLYIIRSPLSMLLCQCYILLDERSGDLMLYPTMPNEDFDRAADEVEIQPAVINPLRLPTPG
jgi:hypothetical protein